jgi:Type I restriction modification DNA specificity domain
MQGSIRLSEVTEALFAGFPPLSRASIDHVLEALEPSPASVQAVGLRALHTSGTIRKQELERVIPPVSKRVPYFQLQSGDVLVAVRGSLEKAAIVTMDFEEPVYATANIAVLRPKRGVLDSFYLWSWIQGLQVLGLQGFRRASTGQLSISTKELGRLTLSLPPLPEQQEIGRAAETIWQARQLQQAIVAQYERTFRAFLAEQFTPRSSHAR